MRSVLLVVGVAWLVGCDARSDPVAYEIDVPLGLSVDDRGRFLTAAATERLDANGFFTLPQREPGVPGRQLSRREAIDAAGFVG